MGEKMLAKLTKRFAAYLNQVAYRVVHRPQRALLTRPSSGGRSRFQHDQFTEFAASLSAKTHAAAVGEPVRAVGAEQYEASRQPALRTV